MFIIVLVFIDYESLLEIYVFFFGFVFDCYFFGNSGVKCGFVFLLFFECESRRCILVIMMDINIMLINFIFEYFIL